MISQMEVSVVPPIEQHHQCALKAQNLPADHDTSQVAGQVAVYVAEILFIVELNDPTRAPHFAVPMQQDDDRTSEDC